MTPSSDLLMMASSADSMMAESQKGAMSWRSGCAPQMSVVGLPSGAGFRVWSSDIRQRYTVRRLWGRLPILRGKVKDVTDYTDAARLFPRRPPKDSETGLTSDRINAQPPITHEP